MAVRAKRTCSVIVATADVLHRCLLVRQRRLRHRVHMAVVEAGRRAGHGAGGRHGRAPSAAATLHCELERIARTDDHVLGVLMTHMQRVRFVDLDQSVADLQTGLIGETADVDLIQEKCLTTLGTLRLQSICLIQYVNVRISTAKGGTLQSILSGIFTMNNFAVL